MDLATVDKLLTTTRTVWKRLDVTRPVDPEIIQTCLEIAIQAPTGGNIAGAPPRVVPPVAEGY
jgi:nitroreductase